MYIWPYSRALLQGAVQDKNSVVIKRLLNLRSPVCVFICV